MCNDNHNDPQDNSRSRSPNKKPVERAHDQKFRFRQGWVIEGQRSKDGSPTGRYLQIGTGQWCPQQYATVFPIRQTAVIYANEFGYSVGHNACVVRYFDHEQ